MADPTEPARLAIEAKEKEKKTLEKIIKLTEAINAKKKSNLVNTAVKYGIAVKTKTACTTSQSTVPSLSAPKSAGATSACIAAVSSKESKEQQLASYRKQIEALQQKMDNNKRKSTASSLSSFSASSLLVSGATSTGVLKKAKVDKTAQTTSTDRVTAVGTSAFERRGPSLAAVGSSGSSGKKQPCRHFLGNGCHDDDCPFLHVKVSSSAAVCPGFLQGYCAEGTACKLKHFVDAPSNNNHSRGGRGGGRRGGRGGGDRGRGQARGGGIIISSSASSSSASLSSQSTAAASGAADLSSSAIMPNFALE